VLQHLIEMSAILFDITMAAFDCGIHIENTYFPSHTAPRILRQ